jgi:hypothetical protein
MSKHWKTLVRRSKDINHPNPEIALRTASEKLRTMRCSKHQVPPRVTVNADSFSVATCCEDLKSRVLEALSEPLIQKPQA